MTTRNSTHMIRKQAANEGNTNEITRIHLLIRLHTILFSLLLPILLSACGFLNVQGSGLVVSQTRRASDFNHVVFGGIGELLITQNGEESLIVSADDNLLDYIKSEVRGDTLFIEVKEPWGAGLSPSQPIRFSLNVSEIIGLDVAGQVNAEAGDLVTDRLSVNVSGLSSLRIGALQAQELILHLSGSNQVELTGAGEVVEQEIVMSGPNSYRAPGLRSKRADVTINGPGDATVWTTDFLGVTVSGEGSVEYYGSPQVSQHGSGKVNLSSLGNP